jgi:hypothetical protein
VPRRRPQQRRQHKSFSSCRTKVALKPVNREQAEIQFSNQG